MKSSTDRYTTLLPTLLSQTQRLIAPAVSVGSFIVILYYSGILLEDHYLAMVIVIFLLSLIILKETDLLESASSDDAHAHRSNLFFYWGTMILALNLIGTLTETTELFDVSVLFTWALVTPIIIFLINTILSHFLLLSLKSEANQRKVVIIGANKESFKLANNLNSNLMYGMKLKGYFDDRSEERTSEASQAMGINYLGKMDLLHDYVKKEGIDIIYITLPVSKQKRVLDMLDELHDTTASVYFMPDVFVYELIQARMDSIADMPLVALCETPFSGMNGVLKRLSDIIFSVLILLLIFPILLIVGLAVKLTSPGPMLFAQKRYGLDGDEIVVYKFRSMTVCDDGDDIKQATRNDARVTPLGAILRKYSLDELPQFINVLQGRMSVVGPRPHAVAHNEMYRGMIKGYMMRHKVKPGITGWAQVNGYRGETDTVEKMQKRIEYDLDYLRNWSLGLDVNIIFNTVATVVQTEDTY
ncbi:MAG: undecaprenyl-phosphate glucose phosphotransferase [Woeseiaceae bacterium]